MHEANTLTFRLELIIVSHRLINDHTGRAFYLRRIALHLGLIVLGNEQDDESSND